MKEKCDSTNTNALVQVGVHIVITMIFGQVNQDPRSAAAIPGPAEAAVADPPARRAAPLLAENIRRVAFHQHANAKDQRTTEAFWLPNSAEHLGPLLRNGCGDRGRRTDPGLQRTLGYGSWSWCQWFSGGTGDKWFPEYMGGKKRQALFSQRIVTSTFRGLGERNPLSSCCRLSRARCCRCPAAPCL